MKACYRGSALWRGVASAGFVDAASGAFLTVPVGAGHIDTENGSHFTGTTLYGTDELVEGGQSKFAIGISEKMLGCKSRS